LGHDNREEIQIENSVQSPPAKTNFQRLERREWWLWSATIIVTLLLTFGVVSFILPELRAERGAFSWALFPPPIRALVAVVLLFDIYAIYQQLQIHYVRRRMLEREELFRLINENVADMIAVVGADGRRIYNSLSYQKVLGYSPEELQKSSSLDQIHPEDRERVSQAAEEARQTGIGKTIEYRIRHKDGTWRVFESTASVIRGNTGVSEKLVIVNRDITERIRAVEALRRSESSFRAAVEDAPYGIYRADSKGCFLRVNPALRNMLGYPTSQELAGVNLETGIFRNPVEFQRVNELLAGADEFKDVEVEWIKKDGSSLAVRCCGRKLEGESSAYSEVFVEDITEKRILERQLRMAAKMEAVGRLSGGIAHDFNNLLGVIIGYGQVLKQRLGPDNPLFEHAEEIEKAGQRAASLTRQLLAFSRQQILSPTVLDLNALVSDMEKMLPRLLGEDITVTTVLAPALGTVKADRSQIEQILMNLAVNARDAMPQGGKLIFETGNKEFDAQYIRQHPGAKLGSYVMLSVTDSGMGMDSETQAHIFEPFFTTKELGKGTGLGLATVYGVVKQSDGYIWVDSAPGKGASFKVFLPHTLEAVVVSPGTPVSWQSLTRTETILLAEDSEPLRKLAKSFLEAHGFTVLSACDGADALRIAENHAGPVHLLLTDVIMPGMNGRVLAERLLARDCRMKIMYMSGYTDSFIAGHGVLEKGSFLLNKPFTEEALIQKVLEVLGSETGELAQKSAAPLFVRN
jgi:two-component system cell cycle sensor histidine kinase/response regulator CckA